MWNYPDLFDVIVVGGGHAGCEAAYASAKMGRKTLLLTMNLDTIAKASCNPSIGGTAKGHIVREIDALGGIMGKITDQTGIHFRMLNSSKGPAVRSPRAQIDKHAYSKAMKHCLENTENLLIKQGTTTSLICENHQVKGVETQEGIAFLAKTVVLTTGTFLNGMMHIGHHTFPGGRGGDPASLHLSASLEKEGLKIGRLKTGTPPRIHARSIDFSQCEIQPTDEGVYFSYDASHHPLPSIPCYITHTTQETKKVIQRDLKKSALFSGRITGIGPRYCPSIEDKMVRFADKERHQIFLEPEGHNNEEYYINGSSTSMPWGTQLEIIRSLKGLENAEILRPAYAIEYDCVVSGQILATLETKTISHLFLAGQINGTTGYEEAAGQGQIAGINAALKSTNDTPFILPRSSSYIGVMIDDLICKIIDEPYRMFTSRAEHRLLLRQDNADLRLREMGYKLGLISEKQYEDLKVKETKIKEGIEKFKTTYLPNQNKKTTIATFICNPENSFEKVKEIFPDLEMDIKIFEQIQIEIQFAGYLNRQIKEIEKLTDLEKILIPRFFAFDKIVGLRKEAKEKLKKHSPMNLAQAAQLAGVSFGDISILMISLQKKENFIDDPS
jgi:tRNA uridine 5-carboxymethylaminomethyl modification enzyme